MAGNIEQEDEDQPECYEELLSETQMKRPRGRPKGSSTLASKAEAVDHPSHYGGQLNPFETIKVVKAWGLGFSLGNCVKYISRAGKKGDRLEDLQKAAWYLNDEILEELAKRERDATK